jgi:hypothetical protein
MTKRSTTKRLLVGISVLLSTAIALPVFAQAAVPQPDRYALYLPDRGTGVQSAPPIRPWKAGNETAAKPWLAPLGHHQPTAADVLTSDPELALDQEDAKIDRIVRGICRGC